MCTKPFSFSSCSFSVLVESQDSVPLSLRGCLHLTLHGPSQQGKGARPVGSASPLTQPGSRQHSLSFASVQLPLLVPFTNPGMSSPPLAPHLTQSGIQSICCGCMWTGHLVSWSHQARIWLGSWLGSPPPRPLRCFPRTPCMAASAPSARAPISPWSSYSNLQPIPVLCLSLVHLSITLDTS